MKNFLKSMEKKPSKTISTYVGAVKVFLRDNDAEISDKQWRKLRKRGFMTKRIKAKPKRKSQPKPNSKES